MRRVKLGQICEVVSGGTPKTNVEEYWNGEFNWITPAEINDNDYIISDTKRKITQLAIEKKKLPLLPKGTVLLSSRAPILEFPQFYPQTSDFSPFIINNFMKMPKI